MLAGAQRVAPRLASPCAADPPPQSARLLLGLPSQRCGCDAAEPAPRLPTSLPATSLLTRPLPAASPIHPLPPPRPPPRRAAETGLAAVQLTGDFSVHKLGLDDVSEYTGPTDAWDAE